MEKLNLNFSGGENIVNSICWIMSYLSWLMLVITGWISIKWLDEDPSLPEHHGWTIWTISAWRGTKAWKDYFYMPFQMHVSLIYIVFILALLIILGGCIVFFIKTIFKKDDQVKTGMMGQFSKFHFFPLLCASALFIIGECVDKNIANLNHDKKLVVSGLVFSILGLASMIFIYIMTDLNTQDWWVLLLLKKGTYSCLIILMWYYFCYDIYYVRLADKPLDPKNLDWQKGCGLAFSIIFGIGSLAFGYFFKDLVVCCMNTLIYVGLTVYYFKINKEFRKLKDYNKNGDGIVDIIMLVLSVALIAFLLLKHKDDCFKS
jgi:hypothetical protein